MKYILASKSPRRKELLEQIGIKPVIMVSDADENIEETNPVEMVKKLSSIKASAVKEKIKENDEYVIIGADTIVCFNNEIMGKPSSKEEAYRMIKLIEGNVHSVFTGFTIIFSDGRSITDYVETKVFVYPMKESEIEDYISTNEPYDKAGAYGIQGLFGRYVEKIEGDYNNVVGLPVSRIMQYI
ncbi:MAG: Maf family protein [Lachnospiraceae bacterium]|nr:Maf family protein [Lachnospiraceae bacterium]